MARPAMASPNVGSPRSLGSSRTRLSFSCRGVPDCTLAPRQGQRGAMRAEDVRTVGVIGCGLMGSGISEVVARAGQTAGVLRPTHGPGAPGGERRGRDGEERTAVLRRLSLTTDVQALADVDLVIEAATEDHDTKVGMFRRL